MSVAAIYTKEELQALTGARQRATVIRQLQRNDVPFVIAADGWPRVARDWIPGRNVVSLRDRRNGEPDLDALAS